jgi:hypothetical protein
MRTDDLIQALVQDTTAREASLTARISTALLLGGAVAAVLFAMTLGIRPDIADALHTGRFPLKFALTLLCALSALSATIRLAHPDARLLDVATVLAAAPILLAAAVGVELLLVPPANWAARAVGSNSRVCLAAIPLLSIAPLIGVLAALRAGAPRSPTVAGAVGGLLAGALGATLYATHCPDDSPLFVAIWYTLGLALVAVAGALAGRRVLRW